MNAKSSLGRLSILRKTFNKRDLFSKGGRPVKDVTVSAPRTPLNIPDSNMIDMIPFELLGIFAAANSTGPRVLSFEDVSAAGKLIERTVDVVNITKPKKRGEKGLFCFADMIAAFSHGNEKSNFQWMGLQGDRVRLTHLPLKRTDISTLLCAFSVFQDSYFKAFSGAITLAALVKACAKNADCESYVAAFISIMFLWELTISIDVPDDDSSESSRRYQDLMPTKLFDFHLKAEMNQKDFMKSISDILANRSKSKQSFISLLSQVEIIFAEKGFDKIIKRKLKRADSVSTTYGRKNTREGSLFACPHPIKSGLSIDVVSGYAVLYSYRCFGIKETQGKHEDKTFSLDGFADILGHTYNVKTKRGRFLKTLKPLAGVFGAMSIEGGNIVVKYGFFDESPEVAKPDFVQNPPEEKGQKTENRILSKTPSEKPDFVQNPPPGKPDFVQNPPPGKPDFVQNPPPENRILSKTEKSNLTLPSTKPPLLEESSISKVKKENILAKRSFSRLDNVEVELEQPGPREIHVPHSEFLNWKPVGFDAALERLESSLNPQQLRALHEERRRDTEIEFYILVSKALKLPFKYAEYSEFCLAQKRDKEAHKNSADMADKSFLNKCGGKLLVRPSSADHATK